MISHRRRGQFVREQRFFRSELRSSLSVLRSPNTPPISVVSRSPATALLHPFYCVRWLLCQVSRRTCRRGPPLSAGKGVWEEEQLRLERMTRAGMVGLVAAGVLGWFVMAASSLRSLDVTGGASSQAQERTYRGVQLRSNFRVLQQVQHDPNAFTQGLFLYKDVLYEGTGLQGYSSVRKVDPQTGSVLSQTRLASTYFGEGITLVGDKIVQLTWKHRKAFVYKADDLSQVGSFDYNTVTGEGWGATTSDKEIIVSDGSEWLVFWDKETYRETRRVRVVDGTGQPVEDLNELEYVEGYVFANIWMANNIAQIDPATGKVVAFYDFSSLFPTDRRMSMDDVLNGIAYDHQRKILWLTGKRWPMYYKVELCGVPELNMQAPTCSDSGQ